MHQKLFLEPRKDESENISQLLNFPGLSLTALNSDGTNSLLKLFKSNIVSLTPELHAQVKQCLSNDGIDYLISLLFILLLSFFIVFLDAEYRKNVLMELDAKNITNSRSNYLVRKFNILKKITLL